MPAILWILGPPGAGKTTFYHNAIKPLNFFQTILDVNDVYSELLKTYKVKYDLPEYIVDEKILSNDDYYIIFVVNSIFQSYLEQTLPTKTIIRELKVYELKPEIIEKCNPYENMFFTRETLLLLFDLIDLRDFPNVFDYIKYKGETLENFHQITHELIERKFIEAKNNNANICIIDNGHQSRKIFDINVELEIKRKYKPLIISFKNSKNVCRERFLLHHNAINEQKFGIYFDSSLIGISKLRDFTPKIIYDINNDQFDADHLTNWLKNYWS